LMLQGFKQVAPRDSLNTRPADQSMSRGVMRIGDFTLRKHVLELQTDSTNHFINRASRMAMNEYAPIVTFTNG